MYSDSLDLQAVIGEREALVARYRRERAGLRASSATLGAPSAIARLFTAAVRPLQSLHRPGRVAERGSGEASGSRPAAS